LSRTLMSGLGEGRSLICLPYPITTS
jgi:hypothetical protein